MRAPDPSPSEAPPSRAVFFQVFPSVMLPMFLALLVKVGPFTPA
jgi:hypothetical protein